MLLTLLYLWSLRNIRTTVSTRWAFLLTVLFWIMSLGPVIRWQNDEILLRNQLWLWALKYQPILSVVRTPYRFIIGMYWVMAWQVALELDRWKVPLPGPLKGNRIFQSAALSLILVILFSTDFRVPFRLYFSQNIAEPVHHRLGTNSIVIELPTSSKSPVRFQTTALANELHFRTADGQAGFSTPLSAYLLKLSRRSLRRRDLSIFQAIGLTSIILHCHLFKESSETANFCQKDEDLLTKSGYDVRYRDGNDILLESMAREGKHEMIYTSLDLDRFELSQRANKKELCLKFNPLQPVFVAFPERCFPFEVHILPSGEISPSCYRSPKSFVAESFCLDIPARAEAVRVVEPTTGNEVTLK